MAMYVDEEEVWKCPKHPYKRRRSGICPICLRERLISLCPDCANVRPCACCATTSSSSSSSSSFSRSFSRFSSRFSTDAASAGVGVGAVDRVSNLIESEPSFRRSRSVAVPFLRLRFVGGEKDTTFSGEQRESPTANRSKMASLLSKFGSRRSKRSEVLGEDLKKREEIEIEEEVEAQRRRMMMKSRSVAVTSESGGGGVKPSKGRGWYFPSPIKVFRQSRISKVVQERSPLYRG